MHVISHIDVQHMILVLLAQIVNQTHETGGRCLRYSVIYHNHVLRIVLVAAARLDTPVIVPGVDSRLYDGIIWKFKGGRVNSLLGSRDGESELLFRMRTSGQEGRTERSVALLQVVESQPQVDYHDDEDQDQDPLRERQVPQDHLTSPLKPYLSPARERAASEAEPRELERYAGPSREVPFSLSRISVPSLRITRRFSTRQRFGRKTRTDARCRDEAYDLG